MPCKYRAPKGDQGALRRRMDNTGATPIGYRDYLANPIIRIP
jgi:hypothetical protein